MNPARAFAIDVSHDGSTKDEPSAREVLRDWARAPGYSKRAAEILELARSAPLPALRKRYLRIAEHYRQRRLLSPKFPATLAERSLFVGAASPAGGGVDSFFCF